jgi:hypothetical protein
MRVSFGFLPVHIPKATLFALFAGCVIAAASWWILPASPRSSLNRVTGRNHRHLMGAPVLSRDFCYALTIQDADLVVWELGTSRRLFSIKDENRLGSHWFVFSPDGQLLVEMPYQNEEGGEVNYRIVPSGEPWNPSAKAKLLTHSETATSFLGTDIQSHPFVAEWKLWGPRAVRELESPDEPITTPASAFIWLTGGYLAFSAPYKVVEVRAWPEGTLYGALPANAIHGVLGRLPELIEALPADALHSILGRLPELSDSVGLLAENGKTLALVRKDGIDVWDLPTATLRVLDMSHSNSMPCGISNNPFGHISADGCHIATRAYRQGTQSSLAWLNCLFNALGIEKQKVGIALYDLTTARETAFFPESEWAQFSADGKSLAILVRDTLEIYDFPLRRPWFKIVGYGLAAAAGVWLFTLFSRRHRAKRKMTRAA